MLPQPSGKANVVHNKQDEPTSREQRRAHRMDELLDHAMHILDEEGPKALTMPRLAKEADAAVGALYRYFDGKATLVAALQQRAIEALHDSLEQDLAQAATLGPKRTDALALYRIRVQFTAWTRYRQRAPHLFRLIDSSMSDPEPNLPDEIAAEVNAAIGPLFQVSHALFTEATDAGALSEGDAALRTRVIWAAFYGIEHFSKRDRFTEPELRTDAVRQELLRSLLAGWGAPPVPLREAMTAALPAADALLPEALLG
jgi:AcrR family transcriptional regulator